jgi:hypothetical protein
VCCNAEPLNFTADGIYIYVCVCVCVCVYIYIYLSLGFKWLILVLPLGTRVAQSAWSLISGPDNLDDRNRNLLPHKDIISLLFTVYRLVWGSAHHFVQCVPRDRLPRVKWLLHEDCH